MRANWPWTLRTSASTSGRSTSTSGTASNLATRYGSSEMRFAIRTRCRPPTRIRCVPSGTLIILWTIATVPISWMSSQPGASIDESFAVTSASSRSPATTSSISRTERSCPIASGVIDCGKTTISLSGSTGRTAGSSTSLGLGVVGQLEGDVASSPLHLDRDAAADRARGACSVTGSVTVTMPRSNSALARSGSTSSGRRTRRRNGPYSISICW